MSEYKKIGIIVADEDEFKPLADLVTRGKFSESEFLKRRILRFKSGPADIYAMHCGVGKVNAAAAAAHSGRRSPGRTACSSARCAPCRICLSAAGRWRCRGGYPAYHMT